MFDEDVLRRMQQRDREHLARSADMERDAATVRFTGISQSEIDLHESHRLKDGIEKAIADVIESPNANDVAQKISAFTWRGVLLDAIQDSIVAPEGDGQIDAINIDSVKLQAIIPYNAHGGAVSLKPLNMLRGWSLQRLSHILLRALSDNYVNSIQAEEAYRYVIKNALVELIKGLIVPLSSEMMAIVNVFVDNTSSDHRFMERSRVLDKFTEKTGKSDPEFTEALDFLIEIESIEVEEKSEELKLTEKIWDFLQFPL